MDKIKLDKIKLVIIQNKRTLIIGLAVLFIALGLVFSFGSKKGANEMKLAEGCKPGDNFSQTTGKRCTDEPLEACKQGDLYDINTGKPCDGVENKEESSKKGNLSYESALKAYAGRSVLFDAGCLATPAELQVSLGSRVLLANNSNTLLKINLEGQPTNLRPYHYLLSTINKAEVEVSCNDSVTSSITAK